MNRDQCRVFIGESFAEAETVAAFLNSEGVPASVIDPSAVGGMEGLSLLAGASAGGLEVWVREPAAAAYARRLLEDHAAELRSTRANVPDLIESDCEECGAKVKFPGALVGTVQECPNCHAYLDVPDPDDDWSDEDVSGDEAAGEDEDRPARGS
jgi:hypothetical protein